MSKKILVFTLLLLAAALSACNLSQYASANEIALNPPTLESEATVEITPTTPSPTRTPIVSAAPTITVLTASSGSASQIVPIAAVSTVPPPKDVCSVKAAGEFDVNVRANAGTEFDIVGVLPANLYVLVIRRAENGWLQVPLGRELVGWVSPRVVTLYGPCSGILSQPPPAPTFVPTPTAFFGSDIGTESNDIITLVDIGGIAKGTTVRVGSAMFTGSDWMYDIYTADGRYAAASQSQLTYSAGGGTPPFPTPTPYIAVSTQTVPVMELPTDVSPSEVVIPEDMCTVTAYTTTNLYAAPYSTTVVGVLNPGPWAQVSAVSSQGWYKVTIWTDGRQGWTTLTTVQLHGPCGSLPVE